MKAISVWQPWASLWCAGFKLYETRGWATEYRGPLLVHASLQWNAEQRGICTHPAFKRCMAKLPSPLPRDFVIGIVNLESVHLITGNEAMPHEELEFGDFTPGRYYWRPRARAAFTTPVGFKGKQGFFDVPDELVAEQLKEAGF